MRRLAALLLCVSLLPSCSNVGYYVRSAEGQLRLVRNARPIEDVCADPRTEAGLKQKLEAVQEMREFACRELALPDNASYRRYADVGRPYAVWNVVATPEFSLEPKRWCFPVAGCVNYRGYFSKEEAEAYASKLRAEGYDVLVNGVPAYSTLGWFDDPVLSTFIRYPEPELARLLFHELAHQIVYVKDDSIFNESFATAVELEGLQRWALQKEDGPEFEAAIRSGQRKRQFQELIRVHRDRLQALYRSDLEADRKRQAKREALEALRADYRLLKESWGGYGGYDGWFGSNLGNSHLASVSLYMQLVPAFQELLHQSGGNLAAFYAAVRDLARLPKAERSAKLRQAGEAAEARRASLPQPAVSFPPKS
jgi:predicted aminopeptidase